jgi:signal transduction histidine kinase
MHNLLENAAHFSPPRRPIEVTLTEQDTTIRVSIRDHGVGIPESELGRIFDCWHRAAGQDASPVYGHGLGLYLARQMIEEMNGRIWVESQVSQGSTFHFVLPKEGYAQSQDQDSVRG